MLRKRERITSKNLVDMQTDTHALRDELLLPGGKRPRKNSLKQELREMAEIQGEVTSQNYEDLLAAKVNKYAKDKTLENLYSLIQVQKEYIPHLLILGRYHYYCLIQALKIKDKRQYAGHAIDKATTLLEQINSMLTRCDEGIEDDLIKALKQKALDLKDQHTELDKLLQANPVVEKIINNQRSSVASPGGYTQTLSFLTSGLQGVTSNNDVAPQHVASSADACNLSADLNDESENRSVYSY